MPQLFVLRGRYVEKLWDAVETTEGLEPYRRPGTFPLDSSQLLVSPISTAKDAPTLIVKAGGKRARSSGDLENALAIFEWLGDLPDADARDPRLWAWLAHAVFPDYCRQRWPLPSTDKSARNSVHDHWFVRGGGRAALRRHAIARLWWAVHLTHAPWKTDPEFAALETSDDFIYSRILLSNQDVYLAILERAFGGSQRILIALLETLRRSTESHSSLIKSLSKDVNLISRYRELAMLKTEELIAIFESVATPTSSKSGILA